jgi:protein-S-isoprenylcysteine O-methyltransferase Ste14
MAIATTPSDDSDSAHALSRAVVLTYGLVVYACFGAIFLYLIGFVGGAVVPKTLDDGTLSSIPSAIAINVGFLALFAIQHTIMARPAFKKRWTRIIPEAVERTTFVALTVVILVGMVVAWRPLPDVVWQVEGFLATAIHGVFWLGWGIVLLSTFLIDHFELFGVRQTIDYARGKKSEPAKFQERSLYRFVRHPLMLGFILAFWATPTMTQGHLLFAGVTTAYILIALFIEEKTLVELHGQAYEDYQKRVPKLIPRIRSAR